MSEQDPFDLKKLIEASEIESRSTPDDIAAAGDSPTHQPMINQRIIVAFSWIACGLVAAFMYLSPAYPVREPGAQSIEKRLGTAVYHAAHRVETYRRNTGSLPEYLEPEWHEGESVSYEIVDARYVLTGRMGDLTIIYSEGEDPEKLLGRQPASAEVLLEQ
jgi:hypothetical protein